MNVKVDNEQTNKQTGQGNIPSIIRSWGLQIFITSVHSYVQWDEK